MTSIQFAGSFVGIPLSTDGKKAYSLTMPNFLDVLGELDARRAQYGGQYEAMAYEQDGAVYGAIKDSSFAEDEAIALKLLTQGAAFNYYPGDAEMLQIDDKVQNTWLLSSHRLANSEIRQAVDGATGRLYQLA